MTALRQDLSLRQLLCEPALLRGLTLRDWDLLLRLARSANLLGRLADAAQQVGLQPPPQMARHLLSAQRLNLHQRQAIAWECEHLAQALAALDIPVVLLKGAAYVMGGLDAARGRLFGDVDLLVPRAALSQVEAALMMRGWTVGQIDPYDQRYYRQWMHELPPMVNHMRGTVVDVHHNILPLSARAAPDAAALLAASLPIPGTPFRRLAPCDMLIHSATHLFHEGELRNGLRDLYDLDSLLRGFAASEADFWPRLLARAQQLQLAWPLHLALRYSQRLLGTPVPAEVLQAAARQAGIGPLRQALLDFCYEHALSPQHPLAEGTSSALARAWLYLRGHALRMPPWQLALHLGRKAVLRLFKHTSRSA